MSSKKIATRIYEVIYIRNAKETFQHCCTIVVNNHYSAQPSSYPARYNMHPYRGLSIYVTAKKWYNTAYMCHGHIIAATSYNGDIAPWREPIALNISTRGLVDISTWSTLNQPGRPARPLFRSRSRCTAGIGIRYCSDGASYDVILAGTRSKCQYYELRLPKYILNHILII